jgi:hypothetical protein
MESAICASAEPIFGRTVCGLNVGGIRRELNPKRKVPSLKELVDARSVPYSLREIQSLLSRHSVTAQVALSGRLCFPSK